MTAKCASCGHAPDAHTQFPGIFRCASCDCPCWTVSANASSETPPLADTKSPAKDGTEPE